MSDEKQGRLIEIALNRPLWNTYTYCLPEEMDNENPIGCRVIVPLGKSRVIGYIWGITHSAADIRIKNVLARLDTSPLLPPNILELVHWAAEYYQAPPGMMIAAAHPPGISGKAEKTVMLLDKLDPSNPLSELLPLGSAIPARILKDNLNRQFPLEKHLAQMETDGIIRIFWKPVSEPEPVRERMIEPFSDSPNLTRKAEAIRKRAPKQAEILFYLATSETAVPRRQLLLATGANHSSVRALINKKLIREFYRRKYREPFTNIDIEDEKKIPTLSEQQNAALESICGNMNEGSVFLLHGVTGSGKTEVYLRAISEVIKKGRNALVLVPEISLTPLTVSRFSRRFPGLVTVLHSGMTPGERLDSWNLAKQGKRKIVIGPRSAIFAPLPDTGIIVVDEEHDSSYKQNELPRYNGRDIAVVRSMRENIPVILGSASPSMESYGNSVKGKYRLLELKERIDGLPMPETILVNAGRMKHPLLSKELLIGIGKRTVKGEQCIVLINRRGFSPTQMCKNCGHREECPNCGVTLTYHRKGQVLRCHYCGHWKAALRKCPKCGFDEFSHMGPGIQKVEEALGKLLPQTKVIRMDADTTRGKNAHWNILGSFAKGSGDVLLGTQMVAKGHDFPGVTLVGIIAADMGLAFPDFRAAERTFQLILQVAGRAGRGSIPGEVVLQTIDIENTTIRTAARHDYKKFWKDESKVRKAFGYPPFGNLIRFVWSGLDNEKVRKAAHSSVKGIQTPAVNISSPQEAAFPRINRRWRWSALARSSSRKSLAELSRRIRKQFEKIPHPGVRLEVDVDPHNLL
ncbi:MAG: primosomal protein N' [Candidatus Aegiribacteria sp.]|nr:primosomal protein N' [Candidatus Aegiribacteria sp.]